MCGAIFNLKLKTINRDFEGLVFQPWSEDARRAMLKQNDAT